MPTALALSPHLDDAAFSSGALLAGLASSGWRVVLCTVFTASVPDPTGFALACQLDKGLSPEVDYMALRRAEDEEAASALGAAPPLWLPFREAPHRGYGSAAALFEGVRPDDTIDEAVAEAFRDLFAAERPHLVLAPQAVGGHVDHVQVVCALDAAGAPAPVLFWRDFPYTIRPDTPAEPFRARMEGLPLVSLEATGPQAERKRQSCRAYRSQLGYQFGGPEGLDAKLAGSRESYRLAGSLPV